MELLLNLIWVTLGMGAFLIFMRCYPQSSLKGLPYSRALLALASVLLLLFPVVSASDDLHPAQALMEEASKRIPQFASPLQASSDTSTTTMLPILWMLALSLLFALTTWQPWRPVEVGRHALSGYRLGSCGRAPPSFLN
jgi:hypothetical protein